MLVASRRATPSTRRVAEAIRGQLLGLGVAFHVLWVDRIASDLPAQSAFADRLARKHRAQIVVWCRFSTPNQVFLYLSQSGTGRLLVRRVGASADGAMGRFEAIGAIVRGSVGALLRGGRIGVRVDLRRQPSPRRIAGTPSNGSRVAPPARSLAVALHVGYTLTGLAAEEPLVHTGLAGFSLRFLTHWSVLLDYSFAPGISVEQSDITLKIFSHQLRLGGGFHWPLGRFSIGAHLALSLVLLQLRTFVQVSSLNSSGNRIDPSVGIDVTGTGSYAIRSWVSVYAQLGVRIMLLRTSYDASLQGQRVALLEPWPAQPFGLVGIRFRFGGWPERRPPPR